MQTQMRKPNRHDEWSLFLFHNYTILWSIYQYLHKTMTYLVVQLFMNMNKYNKQLLFNNKYICQKYYFMVQQVLH